MIGLATAAPYVRLHRGKRFVNAHWIFVDEELGAVRFALDMKLNVASNVFKQLD